MVLLGIITSLFIAIQDPVFQKFAARFASGYLSEKTGGDIKVGRLLITPDFTVYLDDVIVKDLNDNDLANVGSLRAKLDLGDLLNGDIHLETVTLRDTKANLIKYEGEEKFNFAFLVDAFKTDTVDSDKGPVRINIDKIVVTNLDFVYWNQNKDHPDKTERHLMDYSHIAVDDINLRARDLSIVGDSISARINALNGKEISGLEIKSFEVDAVVCSQGIYLDGLKSELNNTRIDADVHMLYNDYADINSFVDSVVFDATIRPTQILLSDVGVFSEVMYKMPDDLRFQGRFTGPIKHFSVDDFKAEFGKSTVIEGDLSMHPLDFFDGEHEMNIKRLQFTYDDLANFYIPTSTKTIPLPESLRPMKTGRASLKYKGSYNNFNSEVHLVSGIGNVDLDMSRQKTEKGDNVFTGYIDAENVDAGLIANAQKYVGSLDLNADFVARVPAKGYVDLMMKGKAYQAELLGHRIDEIVLNGDLKENRFKGAIAIDDKVLGLDFNGLVDFNNKKYPVANFKAVVDHADLRALKLIKNDSISEISTNIVANLRGFNLDDLEGELHLDNTFYRDGRGSYEMDDFDASIRNDNLMQRKINVNCDFFNFEMAGQMNFASLIPVFNEFVDSFVHFPLFQKERDAFKKYALTHDVDQDFVVSLLLKDTQTLSRLLMPDLKIAKNTSVNGTFTSRSRQLNLTARSKCVEFGKLAINNLELKNFNGLEAFYGALSIGGVYWTNITPTDTVSIGLDNLSVFTKMDNDTIATRIRWDDNDILDHNKAMIETTFHPHLNGGIFNIGNAEIIINDSLWNVSPSNFIDITEGKVNISNLMFSHNRQSLRLDGFAPMNEGDTISVQLRDFDLSNFDVLTMGMGINADGFVTGDALVSSLKDAPMVLADLRIDQLGLNGDLIGDTEIESSWDNEDKSVDLEANIYNDDRRMLYAFGSYYTAREQNNLDFTAVLDSLRLSALNPVLDKFVSRVQGYGNGMIDINGSLKQPDIKGKISIIGGGCKINYLNTFYTFSPSILVDNESIALENMVLVDTLGNKARVEGEIRHNSFKDFYLDLKLHPRDFLALATTAKDNDTFYGAAVANGLVTIKGPLNDIYLDIKARTQNGTNLTIPLNRTSMVKDNDFIIFVSPATDTIDEMPDNEVANVKKKNNFAIDLDIDATDVAKLKIMLPGNIGTIDAQGEGNLKMGTSTAEAFSMYGKYTISLGRFQLTLMELVSRVFTLQKGGSISWTGNPTDGRINATGVYSVKASLADLMQVDSTSSASTNVNVECLIHLKDALLNPTISFGMRLPNASEDVIQTVFSVIDTTNQTVMANQALSLLVFSKFAYAGGSAGAYQTMSLTNLLMSNYQLDITQNMNIGLSYHYGADSYDEYQVALRTELFENRLTIETNVGVMSSNNPDAGGASNIVGEFDLYYKLSKDGRLQAHFYNHSNYNTNFNSFAIDKRAPYTQGLGLSYSRSFPTFRDLFKKKNKQTNQPLIIRHKNQEN
jgi:hypothetical protein